MYLARFSYSVLPVNRDRALNMIEREVKAARDKKLNSRLLVPLTRGRDGASLQFEIEVPTLDEFERFREHGLGSDEATGNWMQAFSEVLTCPPEVELLRIA